MWCVHGVCVRARVCDVRTPGEDQRGERKACVRVCSCNCVSRWAEMLSNNLPVVSAVAFKHRERDEMELAARVRVRLLVHENLCIHAGVCVCVWCVWCDPMS